MGRWYAIHVPDGLHTPVERGITINGLPILLKRPSPATMDIEDLDIYYEDCVIGGPGAFVIPIRERDQFRAATRTKLVQEIASREVAPRVIPAADRKPCISCTIGEHPAPSENRCGSSAGAGWISGKHRDALSPSGRDWAVLKPEIAPGTDLKLQGSTSTKPTRPAVLPLK
jgi:Protein of unknown function (DUF1194)